MTNYCRSYKSNFLLILIVILTSSTKLYSETQLQIQIDSLNEKSNFFSEKTSSNSINYSVEQLDNTSGLSNSSVNAIFQDSENLIWIGTWDGLNRYDGNSFKIFRPEANNENSISNHVVLKVDEDNIGDIWIQTMHGINRYNKKTNKFRRYYFSLEDEAPSSELEFTMILDDNKEVYCAVKGWGVGYLFQDEFKQFNSNNLPLGSVEKIEFSSPVNLIVLNGNNELYSLTIKSEGKLGKVISRNDKIFTNVLDFYILPNKDIHITYLNGDSKLYSSIIEKNYVNTEKGINKVVGYISSGIVLSNKTEYFISDNIGERVDAIWLNDLKGYKISTIIQGSENVIWVGTDGDGLFKIHPLSKNFNQITKDKIPEFNGGIIRAFCDVEGGPFFVGTKGKGLFKFHSKFYLDNTKKLDYTIYNESNNQLSNYVYAISKGQDNLVFIGTDGDGISIYDLDKSKIINWSEVLDSDKFDFFKSTYAIFQDNDGYIWLGTNGYGLVKCKIKRFGEKLKVSEFKRYVADKNNVEALNSNIIFSIVPKDSDELWLGTRLGGLNFLNKKTELFTAYKNRKGDSSSLSNNDILCLYNDEKNRLWIGTSYGLNLLESTNSEGEATFSNFTIKDGLPNNTIHGIVSDKQSNLWVSTNFGISNFKVDESKFVNYTKNEGLQNNEFADGAFYHEVNSNYIFMGGIKGFNYFLSSEIEEYTFIPDLFIDNISGENKNEPYIQSLVVYPTFNTSTNLDLEYDQNFFRIDLSALTYVNSENCQYAFKLENFNQDWVSIGHRKNIFFTNVPPGEYSFMVKWSNSDGVWSTPVRAIDIDITPALWRSNFAYVVYVLLLILLVLLIISYYNERNLLKQNIIFQKKEDEIHRNKLTFFTNIAHELQTPLTLIIGPSQKLFESKVLNHKNRKFIDMIQRNSSRLFFLTQQLLEFRKAEHDYLGVAVREFDLVELVEQIIELFDELALQKEIEYKLESQRELIGWFDKDKIEKILFNLLSNAFKYTPKKGKILLKLSIKGNDINTLHIDLTNTGRGIPKEKIDFLFDRFFLSDNGADAESYMYRTGIGLAYIKKLITVLGGEISVRSKVNKDTTFSTLIPCSKEAFNENEIDKEKSNVLISYHLKNILESVSKETKEIPNKVSVFEAIENDQKTVLIVDDEKDIHLLLEELLSDKYKILKAYNGIEAIKIIENNSPDLIISDVMMPEMDGIEFCEIIKKDIKTCHIPFIMLTAKNSTIHRIEGLESGANSYIPKPFYPDHLLIRVQKLLEEKELITKHFSQNSFNENISSLPLHDEEKDFVKKVIDLIRNNIDNDILQNLYLEKELGLSSSLLYRKIKQTFGLAPGDLIRTIRIKHAADLLQKSSLTVSEVCYRSGFNNRSYFYREFKKVYNTTPKSYQLKFIHEK